MVWDIYVLKVTQRFPLILVCDFQNIKRGAVDNISKYYAISEALNDNIRDVSIAIRISGATQKPSRIHSDLEECWVDKYANELDFLIGVVRDEQSRYIMLAYIRDIKKLSHKYNFSIAHETRIGAINHHYKTEPKKQQEEKEVTAGNMQLTIFDFLGE